MSDIPKFWRKRGVVSWLLWPLSFITSVIIYVRKQLFYRAVSHPFQPPVPLIVIGNLTVGGNGKTPVVMALAKALMRQGLNVGVVSRGYGGRAQIGLEVLATSDAGVVGDEALLIKQQCQVPVFIDKKRVEAVKSLIEQYPQTQVIISDDGLQHYAMGRSLEWVVIARDIGLGNGFLLPAGPLREPVKRLLSVDKVLLHGAGDFKPPDMLNAQKLVSLTQSNKGLRQLADKQAQYQPITAFTQYHQFSALTAIARPERFFHTLAAMGIDLMAEKALPDHAPLSAQEADFCGDGYIIITEKDAVKTQNWPMDLKMRTLVLAHELVLPSSLLESVINHIQHYDYNQKVMVKGKVYD